LRIVAIGMMAASLFGMGQAGAQAGASSKPLSVDSYLARHQSIETRMKALEPDVRAMARVTERAITAYRAEVAEAADAGRPPRGCLPPSGSQSKLSGAEVLAAMRAIPKTQRAMPVQEALFAFFDRRFPCTATATGAPAGPPSR
jgi:hypothetical protein